MKFYLYLIYLITFLWDLESLNITNSNDYHFCYLVTSVEDEYYKDCLRIKDSSFWIRKIVCSIIIILQLIYEMVQVYQEGSQYFQSKENFFDIVGILFYFIASGMDIMNDIVSDYCRILFVFCLLFSLFKMLFLIRVFKSLSFLTKMVTLVGVELIPFMTLFLLFTIIVSECNQIIQVDISAYGRLNSDSSKLFAYFVQTMRSSFGDFSLFDRY